MLYAQSLQWCLTLQPHELNPTRAPLSIGFSRQEYWSGLPFPSAGDLPGPGIRLLRWRVDSLPPSTTWKA